MVSEVTVDKSKIKVKEMYFQKICNSPNLLLKEKRCPAIWSIPFSKTFPRKTNHIGRLYDSNMDIQKKFP